jgi:hypothetical protein
VLSNTEFVFEDAGFDFGATLASAVKNLTAQKKVDVIVGPGLGPQAAVVASLTEKAGVPLITSALCPPQSSEIQECNLWLSNYCRSVS